MPILPNVSSGILNTADELRNLIERCEAEITSLGKKATAEEVIGFLHHVDKAEELTTKLEAEQQVDVRAERSRLEMVENKMRRKARGLVTAARRGNRLAQERRQLEIDKTRWWWYLDDLVAAKNRRVLIKVGSIVLGIVGVFIGLVILLRVFFPPDPIKSAVYDHFLNAELLIRDERDYAGALVEINAALDLTPDDWELWLWQGVLEEKLEHAEKATASFAQARELLDDDAAFHAARGMIYYQLGETDRAMADGQAALEFDSNEPRAYWILSLVYEERGEISKALAAVEQAADLAQERGNLEFVAMARTRQAMLLRIVPDIINTPEIAP